MTMNDLEWPFYVIFSLLRTSQIILHSYRRACLYHVTIGDVRKRTRFSEYLGSAEGLRIFLRRYIVGSLTNKANRPTLVFSTTFTPPLRLPLSPFHWLQNTWPLMTLNGHSTLFCAGMFRTVKPDVRSLASLKLVSEYFRWTSNRKEQLWYRAVSLRKHGFLVVITADRQDSSVHVTSVTESSKALYTTFRGS